MKNKNYSLMDLSGLMPTIEKELLEAVKKVFRSSRYILGTNVKEFEKKFAKFCNAKYCVGTSSGYSALYVSLIACGVEKGDEVVTVPNTFTATAEAIVMAGAKPVFCDIDPKTYNMDMESLKRVITKKTKAIIPVHLHGNPVDMEPLLKLAKKENLIVIEDAAQAHGSIYRKQIIGSLKSDATCFSFHPVKNLGAIGDAGAVVTNKKLIEEKIRLLINHGRAQHNEHVIVGTTNRLDELQAAILLVKLKYLVKWTASRRRLAALFKKTLGNVVEFPEITAHSLSSYHVFSIITPNRDRLASFLEKNGVESGMHYPVSLHLQKAYKFLGYKKGDFPVSERYAKSTLSIPFYPHMKDSDVAYISKLIKSFYKA